MTNEDHKIDHICLTNYYSRYYEELKLRKTHCKESIEYLRERANVLERLINSLKAPEGCQTKNQIMAILTKRAELEREYKECILYIEGYQNAYEHASEEEEFYQKNIAQLEEVSSVPYSAKLTLAHLIEQKK